MRLRILLNICLTFVDFQPLLLIKVLLIKKKRVVTSVDEKRDMQNTVFFMFGQ